MKGEELRAFRRELGLTQAELADRLGVAMNTVSRWEIGAVAMPEIAAGFVRLLADKPPTLSRRKKAKK